MIFLTQATDLKDRQLTQQMINIILVMLATSCIKGDGHKKSSNPSVALGATVGLSCFLPAANNVLAVVNDMHFTRSLPALTMLTQSIWLMGTVCSCALVLFFFLLKRGSAQCFLPMFLHNTCFGYHQIHVVTTHSQANIKSLDRRVFGSFAGQRKTPQSSSKTKDGNLGHWLL